MTDYRRDLMAIAGAFRAMREIGEDMPPHRARILLALAQRPNMTMQELADGAGVTLGSISRNLMALGEKDRHGNPGLRLVETVPDPHEPRRKIARLTPKGQGAVNRMLAPLAALEGLTTS